MLIKAACFYNKLTIIYLKLIRANYRQMAKLIKV